MALVEFVDDSTPYLNASNLNKIQESNIYSTSEIEIGKWIDNKPIYRKTFTGNIADETLLVQNVDVLVNAYGSGRFQGGLIRQLPYYEFYNNYTYLINVNSNNNTIIFAGVAAGQPTTIYDVALSIEYTKTTD